jgi:acetylornithine deacetylase
LLFEKEVNAMESVREVLERLVVINSVSDPKQRPSNRAIADEVSNLCEDAGCAVTQYTYLEGEQINVVATKGGSEPYLALSGHTDTVGFNAKGWKDGLNPLAITERDDCIYGRGVSDMKLALATNIVAAASISPTQLRRPFALYMTAEEEIGCLGAKSLIADPLFQVAPYVVVCEPTGLKVANRHKGYMYMSVELRRERSSKKKPFSHSSDDRVTANVLETYLPRIIQALTEIKGYLRGLTHPDFDPAYTMLNLGDVKTAEGSAKNIIPTWFKLVFDLRPVPGVEMSGLEELVKRRVQRAFDGIPEFPGEQHVCLVKLERQPTPPFLNHDCTLPEWLGETNPHSVTYNTEAGLFQKAGASCAICGPGLISDAHGADEKVQLRYLKPDVVDLYTSTILSACGR